MVSTYSDSRGTDPLFMTQSPMPEDHKAPARQAPTSGVKRRRGNNVPRASSEVHGLPSRSTEVPPADPRVARETTEVVDLDADEDELAVTGTRTIPHLTRTKIRTEPLNELFTEVKTKFIDRLKTQVKALAHKDKHPEDTHELLLRGVMTKISALQLTVPKDIEKIRNLYKKSLQPKLDDAEKLMQSELKNCTKLHKELSAEDQAIFDAALYKKKKGHLEEMQKTRVAFKKLDEDLKEYLAGLDE